VVFAVPNCLGAAAMGWTISSAQASARLVESHRAACRAFSFVTITFQLFFAAWVVRRISPIGGGLAITAAVAAFIYAIGAWRGDRGWRLAAAGAASISLAAMIFGFAHHVIPAFPPPRRASMDLLWLALVCAFGFALNPYFDLTFHRARQLIGGAPSDADASDRNDQRPARFAFGFGFGVLFLIMIAFTLAYSGAAMRLPIRGAAAWMLFWHLSVQLGFTVAAHARELCAHDSADRFTCRACAAALVGAVLIAAALAAFPARAVFLRGMDSGEFIYRALMSFYGLIFPAYAWICMCPTWRAPAKPSRRTLSLFVIACALAAPA
jgi:hypothetical protein